MIGRGSRKLPNKSKFKLIDLGNNVRRFGFWQDYLNWQDAFRFPDRFLESRLTENDDLEFEVEFEFSRAIALTIDTKRLEEFNIKDVYYDIIDQGKKGKVAVDLSMDNHFEVISAAATDYFNGLDLMASLQEHIEHRLKHYTKCISKSTPNYLKYLIETYNRQLRQRLRDNLEDE
jgi:hypothetical protein